LEIVNEYGLKELRDCLKVVLKKKKNTIV